ncbi:SAGA-associated factor 11-like protein [Pyrus ussuriensis x Pyrus communis]|uniref:SAGA-associated factor 11 n=1 Tax=Pyrus ussuriensis x Pyrus communis TaxID=2448454 RepID=A0A5N5FVE8_9ROSA|nr:SAGA-associated factor 11-like protein [Pyrus ussuriensis x Pyrus communis]
MLLKNVDNQILNIKLIILTTSKLGLDRNFGEEEELRLSAYARVRVADPSNSGEANSKVRAKCFECMNCGQSILDRRFAPHLGKCMRKGRKAHLKVTRSSMATQTRNSQGNPAFTYSTYSSSNSISRLSDGASGVAGEEYSNGALEEP